MVHPLLRRIMDPSLLRSKCRNSNMILPRQKPSSSYLYSLSRIPKWCTQRRILGAPLLRNKCRNSILMMCHNQIWVWYCASDCSYYEDNLLSPIRSTSQIWVVTRHQYGIFMCTHSSDVILLGNQCWHQKMLAVFPG